MFAMMTDAVYVCRDAIIMMSLRHDIDVYYCQRMPLCARLGTMPAGRRIAIVH